MKSKPLIIVVGPTASGKSELAVSIAKHLGGEIISADSRQIYRGMDIGAGKVNGSWENVDGKKHFVYKDIIHHGIGLISPKQQYSVAEYQKFAKDTIEDVYNRGRMPILCGGTGHWIDAVVFNQDFPNVPPDDELRQKLDKLPTEALYNKLRDLDPERAADIDPNNRRRLIRALEIVMSTGEPVPKINQRPQYNTLWLGIKIGQDELHESIEERLKQRLQDGMIEEVEKLHHSGIPWKRLEDFGLEYKYCSLYLQNKISYYEMIIGLAQAIKAYAKRQMTWFKRNNRIMWVTNPYQVLKLLHEKNPHHVIDAGE
jgi:tRNA dimethylallyltransferase